MSDAELVAEDFVGQKSTTPVACETARAGKVGYGREEDRERARAAGFDDHLLKPADMAALQELLGRELPG